MSDLSLPHPTADNNTHVEQPDMLRAALWYAKHGFAVFPLHVPLIDHPLGYTCSCDEYRHSDHCKTHHPDLYREAGEVCLNPGKHPRGVKSWTQDSTTDPNMIRAWWRKYPTANIAIDCGKSGILMLDADTYKDDYQGDKFLTKLDEETVTVISGRPGTHLYYRMPEGKTWGNATGELPVGIDIRGHGGFVVAPPSLHASGRRYQFEHGYGPTEINIGNVSPALAAILDAAQSSKSTRYTSGSARWDGQPTTEPVDLAAFRVSDDILSLIATPPAKGQRSEADMRVVVALCYAGATDDDILSIFQHNPIGTAGKFADRGLDYLERTVTAARAYVEAHPPPPNVRQILDALRMQIRSFDFADLVPDHLQSAKGYRTNETDRIIADAALAVLTEYGMLAGRISKLELSARTGKSPNTCAASMRRLSWLFDMTSAGEREAPTYTVKDELRTLTWNQPEQCETPCQSTQLPLATHRNRDAFVRSVTPVTLADLQYKRDEIAAALWENRRIRRQNRDLPEEQRLSLVDVPPRDYLKYYRARLAAEVPSAGPAVLLIIDAVTLYGAMTRRSLAAVLHKKSASSISRAVQRGFDLRLLVDDNGEIDIAPDWKITVDELEPKMPTVGTVRRRRLEAANSRERFCDAALKNTGLAEPERNALHRRLERAAKQKFDLAKEEAPHLTHRNADTPSPSRWDYMTMQRMNDRLSDARIDLAEQQRGDQWRLVAEIQRMRRDGVTKHDAARMLEVAGWMRREVWAAMPSAWPRAVTA